MPPKSRRLRFPPTELPLWLCWQCVAIAAQVRFDLAGRRRDFYNPPPSPAPAFSVHGAWPKRKLLCFDSAGLLADVLETSRANDLTGGGRYRLYSKSPQGVKPTQEFHFP
jgi:hypothetical protein